MPAPSRPSPGAGRSRIAFCRRGGARRAAALPARAAAPAARPRLGGGVWLAATPDETPRLRSRLRERVRILAAGARLAPRTDRGRRRRRAPPPAAPRRRRGWSQRRSRPGRFPSPRDLPLYEELAGDGRARAAVPARRRDHAGRPARAADRASRRCASELARRRRGAAAAVGRRSPIRSRRSTRGSRPPPRRRRQPGGAPRGSRARPTIHVDLHMHTDHSPDCATPVEVLLATARGPRASARSRSPTTTRSRERSRRARSPRRSAASR